MPAAGVNPVLERVRPALLGWTCMVVIVVVFVIVGSLQIIFGSMCVGECPVEPNLPVFSVVYGAAFLFLAAIRVAKTYMRMRAGSSQYPCEAEAAAGSVTAVTAADSRDNVKLQEEEDDPFAGQTLSRKVVGLVEEVGYVFLMSWFIAGGLWTYRALRLVQHTVPPATATYCTRSCFLLAFWTVNVTFMLVGVFIVAGVALAVVTYRCNSPTHD